MNRKGSSQKAKLNQPSGRFGDDTGIGQLETPSQRRTGSRRSKNHDVDGDSPQEVPWKLPSEERADADSPQEKKGRKRKTKAKSSSRRPSEDNDDGTSAPMTAVPNAGADNNEEFPGAYAVQPGEGAERQDPGFISPHEQGASPENTNQQPREEVAGVPVAAEVVKEDEQNFRDEVRRIMAEEAVQAEEVMPIRHGEDVERGLAEQEKEPAKETLPFYKRHKVLIGSLLALLIVGIAVGVAVPLATKSDNGPSAQSNVEGASPSPQTPSGPSATPPPTLSPTIPSPPSTTVPTAFVSCDVTPNNSICLQKRAELRDRSVYGENLITTATVDAGSESECREFCRESFAARYASNVNGDSCICYNSADCLLPWGDQVDKFTIADGDIFTKELLSTCTFDFCDVNPNHWFCFTNQKSELRDNGVYGENLNITASSDAGSRNECLEFCQESFAARYASNAGGDSCICYDSVDCLIPWGNQVNTFTIADGDVYTKDDISTCTFDFCDANPNHWFCFTGQQTELRDNGVHGENLNITASMNARTRNECLEFCQESFAARYASNAGGDSCICYDSVDCLIPWGDQINPFTIADGDVYTKEDISTCTFDFCDANPNHWFCFTGQQTELRDNTVYGVNQTVTASTNARNRNECLEFCQESFAARYASNAAGDSCICYDSVDCLLRWGDQVNTFSIADGNVYTKEDINTCTFVYCDQFPEDALCAG